MINNKMYVADTLYLTQDELNILKSIEKFNKDKLYIDYSDMCFCNNNELINKLENQFDLLFTDAITYLYESNVEQLGLNSYDLLDLDLQYRSEFEDIYHGDAKNIKDLIKKADNKFMTLIYDMIYDYNKQKKNYYNMLKESTKK